MLLMLHGKGEEGNPESGGEAVAKLKQAGKTILLVEQNVREALDLSDRGYVLQTGRTIQQGTGKELLNTEAIQKAFLGL
jgi:branched-chain amino acid transport system ATP-binding protein